MRSPYDAIFGIPPIMLMDVPSSSATSLLLRQPPGRPSIQRVTHHNENHLSSPIALPCRPPSARPRLDSKESRKGGRAEKQSRVSEVTQLPGSKVDGHSDQTILLTSRYAVETLALSCWMHLGRSREGKTRWEEANLRNTTHVVYTAGC